MFTKTTLVVAVALLAGSTMNVIAAEKHHTKMTAAKTHNAAYSARAELRDPPANNQIVVPQVLPRDAFESIPGGS